MSLPQTLTLFCPLPFIVRAIALFKTISHDAVAKVEAILNNRPRKRLDYLTPYEFFDYFNVALET